MISAANRLFTIRVSLWLASLTCLAALAASAATTASQVELRPFTAKSLDELRQANAGIPFIVAFWSVNCGPCKEEMALLKSIHRKHPKLPIVLVATDPPGMRSAILKFLSQHELGRMETWSFADDFEERVRYAVDRRWRGELPRTYFFDAAHRSTAHSGLVDAHWIETWLAREMAPARK